MVRQVKETSGETGREPSGETGEGNPVVRRGEANGVKGEGNER